jgi:hypothetical protein
MLPELLYIFMMKFEICKNKIENMELMYLESLVVISLDNSLDAEY